jgi:hypothetical protein
MGKRFALLWTPFVLVLAFALPATTAAANGYTFTKVTQHCYGSQGQNVYLRVRLTAAGSTTTNKLTINSKSQYFSGGKWRNSYTWKQDKSTFTPNGSSHSIDYSYTHEGNNTYNWRIVSTLKAWHGNQLLASKVLTGLAC